MRRILILIALLCTTAQAQVYKVEVKYPDGKGVASAVHLGSGVFVTAAHVFRGGSSPAISDGRHYYPVTHIRTSRTHDLAACRVKDNRAQFTRATGLVKSIPPGVPGTVCGFAPDRREFCFSVSVLEDGLDGRGVHTLPGDSGGGVFVETNGRKCLAGVHWGYRNDTLQTQYVPAPVICEFLTTQYGWRNCPSCVPYQTPQPIPRPQQQREYRPQPPVEREVSGACRVVVDYDRLKREFMRDYGEQLRGPAGRSGQDGNTPRVDLNELAGIMARDYREQLRGPAGDTPQIDADLIVRAVLEQMPRPQNGVNGQNGESAYQIAVRNGFAGTEQQWLASLQGSDGQQGPRGLIGVPDEDEMAAVVDLWVERNMPKIQQFIRDQSTKSDPRIDGILQRLQALENRKREIRIMDANGNVLDKEIYSNNEPFVFDVRSFNVRENSSRP